MKYEINAVLDTLSKNNSIEIKKKKIIVKGNVGINTWGKIDYLRNCCGYSVIVE